MADKEKIVLVGTYKKAQLVKWRGCELAYQMSFWELPNCECLKPDVPFPAPKKSKFTFIDLFAGIGGFHLAMHELGGKCVFASEWRKCA